MASERTAALSLAAPAKINLYLHIVGRREDGYHLLDSLVAFADVGDAIEIARAKSLELTIGGRFAAALASGPENLVLAAARRLAEIAGIAPRARIKLTKNLPVASGIGGGSADAAAVLRGLVRLWNLRIDDSRLAQLALSLGADVPVCLRGVPAQMSGIGEILTPAPPLPTGWLVLVNPGVAVSTREIFAARQGEFSLPAPLGQAPVDAVLLAAALRERRNDLMPPAVALAPVIGEVIAALEVQPNCLLARMSGSGATCFGLFGTEEAASEAASVISRSQPNWWSVAAKLLPA